MAKPTPVTLIGGEPPAGRVAKTFPPAGRLRLYRLVDRGRFTCDRCTQPKVARLVAVHDAERLVCNACYGELLAAAPPAPPPATVAAAPPGHPLPVATLGLVPPALGSPSAAELDAQARGLFGRRTYEELLASWNAQGGPFKDALNQLAQVRRALRELVWLGT